MFWIGFLVGIIVGDVAALLMVALLNAEEIDDDEVK